MRFRDMSQVTGAQKVRMEAGLRDLRLRPNREHSRHPALRWAHHWATRVWMGLTPVYKTTRGLLDDQYWLIFLFIGLLGCQSPLPFLRTHKGIPWSFGQSVAVLSPHQRGEAQVCGTLSHKQVTWFWEITLPFQDYLVMRFRSRTKVNTSGALVSFPYCPSARLLSQHGDTLMGWNTTCYFEPWPSSSLLVKCQQGIKQSGQPHLNLSVVVCS